MLAVIGVRGAADHSPIPNSYIRPRQVACTVSSNCRRAAGAWPNREIFPQLWTASTRSVHPGVGRMANKEIVF